MVASELDAYHDRMKPVKETKIQIQDKINNVEFDYLSVIPLWWAHHASSVLLSTVQYFNSKYNFVKIYLCAHFGQCLSIDEKQHALLTLSNNTNSTLNRNVVRSFHFIFITLLSLLRFLICTSAIEHQKKKTTKERKKPNRMASV